MEELREPNEACYRTETEGVNECKVIFPGDGAAGKSSLIEHMVDGTLFIFTRYENALVAQDTKTVLSRRGKYGIIRVRNVERRR